MYLKRKENMLEERNKPGAVDFPRDLELELGFEGWVGFL